MNTKGNSELWQRIRVIRKSLDKTQTQFADLLGVNRVAVGHWEAKNPDNRSRPKHENLEKMAELSGFPLNWLLSDESFCDPASWEWQHPEDYKLSSGSFDIDDAGISESLKRLIQKAVEDSRRPPDPLDDLVEEYTEALKKLYSLVDGDTNRAALRGPLDQLKQFIKLIEETKKD